MPSLDNNGRLQVQLLLSAYACHPYDGSEPGVGWEFLKGALSTCSRVDVLTRRNNVSAIETSLEPDELDRCRVIGFDLPHVVGKLKKKLPGGTQVYYVLWQRHARKFVRALHARHRYDLAHHVTFAGDWSAVAVYGVANLPFVWGPVGGSSVTPRHLCSYLGWRGKVTDRLRAGLGALARRTVTEHVAGDASLMIAANGDVERRFSACAHRILIEPNVIIGRNIALRHESVDRDPSLVVCVGRLVPWKGWALALDVIALLPKNFRLEIYGEGPDRDRLQKRARRLGISDRVLFGGLVPRSTILGKLRTAHAMLFPSFHDTSPWAVGEALTMGCPVVSLDLGGLVELLGRAGGRIVSSNSSALADDLALAVLDPVAPHTPEAWSSDRMQAVLRKWYLDALSAG